MATSVRTTETPMGSGSDISPDNDLGILEDVLYEFAQKRYPSFEMAREIIRLRSFFGEEGLTEKYQNAQVRIKGKALVLGQI